MDKHPVIKLEMNTLARKPVFINPGPKVPDVVGISPGSSWVYLPLPTPESGFSRFPASIPGRHPGPDRLPGGRIVFLWFQGPMGDAREGFSLSGKDEPVPMSRVGAIKSRAIA
jgi:hypothetical protein